MTSLAKCLSADDQFGEEFSLVMTSLAKCLSGDDQFGEVFVW